MMLIYKTSVNSARTGYGRPPKKFLSLYLNIKKYLHKIFAFYYAVDKISVLII